MDTMKIGAVLKLLGLIALDIVAIAFIYYLIIPFGKWYLGASPAVGVDLYNSATYAAYHLKHFSFPWNSFKDIWYGGYPLIADYPQLAFMLMVPFAARFGPPMGVQIFSLVSLALFLICSYLLFRELSKNFGVAILLTVGVLLSLNIYGALTWAGSIPSFASQIFFPLGLLFGVKYLKNGSLRYLGLMSLTTALSILIHPLESVTFLIPVLACMIVVGGLVKRIHWQRVIGHLLFFLVGSNFGAFVYTYQFIASIILDRFIPLPVNTAGPNLPQVSSPVSQAIEAFYRDQIASLFTHTNTVLFIMLGIGVGLYLLTWIVQPQKKRIFLHLPLLLVLLYTILHPALNLAGVISVFKHDPYRAFWPFPIALGALAADFWGSGFANLTELFKQLLQSFGKYLGWTIGIGISLTLCVLGLAIFENEIDVTLNRIATKAEYSSAYPEALSISFQKADLQKLKQTLTPKFMDPENKNYRLYAQDAAVNIWWNSFYDLPLARGYIDPPIGTDRRGGFFWLDIAIGNDTLTREFKISETQAYANSLFLIDWYGIGYFEGGRLGSKGPSVAPSTYLTNNNVFDKNEEVTAYGAVLRWQTQSGQPELHPEIPQKLNFFKVADQYASPILTASDAESILVVSSQSGYEDILRLLAANNLNSRTLIPAYAGEYIEDIKSEVLSSFKAVVLHQYNYHNRSNAFKLLEQYVRDGGNVFIDTGADVKEAVSSQLPALFPFSASQRKGFGMGWDLRESDSPVLQGVNTAEFGPLIFNKSDWKLSTTVNPEDLRPGAQVILTHQNKPFLISQPLGRGTVIWSGLNLPYHFNQYKSDTEAALFANILWQFAQIKQMENLPADAVWLKPEKVRITLPQKAKGVLFKEEGYRGWNARLLTEGGKNLPIFLAGPTYPGFMYVPLPRAQKFPATVEFTYSGKPLFWGAFIINVVALFILLDIVLLGNRLFTRHIGKTTRRVQAKMSSWWEKEDA